MTVDLAELHAFIVRAKQATYVGDGPELLPYRLGAHDLQFHMGDWAYHDSYLGERDFIGQEIVYCRLRPVWAMNYLRRILLPERITSVQAGQMIKRSLSRLYQEGRFLGGFEHTVGGPDLCRYQRGRRAVLHEPRVDHPPGRAGLRTRLSWRSDPGVAGSRHGPSDPPGQAGNRTRRTHFQGPHS